LISGRDEAAGNRVVEEAAGISTGELQFFKNDVSKVSECKALIDFALQRFGRIDGLVNNAGVFPRGSLLETDEAFFNHVFDINIRGAFFCTKYAVKAMMDSGGGSIVNIGSTNAFAGMVEIAAYSCSKGALHTLSRHVAANYGQYGIRSNWITVGWVASDGEMQRVIDNGQDMDYLLKVAAVHIPSGRLQTAEDNAYAVVYLLSDESSQVTGTDMHITGGKFFWEPEKELF
jgi:NAD(P)-dependent dehydrogenase (short-subunit alcohol dehydrogenase family)